LKWGSGNKFETSTYGREEISNSLDEMVVVGYGTTIKRELTSSVVTVKYGELNENSSDFIGNAIAGRLAGVKL